uniref:Peptidase A2 domain-containing protein n=1 Tax=Romanomermis culicivorax TaxID=13658 RepID=A0A915IRY3_ROMCU
MPCFNTTAPPLLLEQHFYGLQTPLRSAADTTAHSSNAAASSQLTPAANMVAASPRTPNIAASVAPCIVGWDSMEPQGQLPWVFRPAICNVNEVPPATDALRKYTQTNAFHIPVKISSINTNALIDTGAQCSITLSGLMKHAFNNKMLTLPVCGQIRVADSTIIQAHRPVIVNIESKFSNYLVKCVVLNNDTQDQFI